MRFVLGEIWISLLLATLLGLMLGWLLWKWRRRTIARTDWEDQQAELASRRSSTADLETQMAELVVARNAAETDQVRLSAKIDDLEERAALVPVLEARIARQSQPPLKAPTSPTERLAGATPLGVVKPTSVSEQDQARWAAATATGSNIGEPPQTPQTSLPEPPPRPTDTSSSRRITQLETAAERANDRARDLAAQLDASSTHVAEVDAERVRLRRELDESTQRVRQLDEEVLSTKAKLSAAIEREVPAGEVERLHTQIERTQADLDSRAKQTESLQVELRRRGGDLEARALESNRLGAELAKARDALDRQTAEAVAATEAFSQLEVEHSDCAGNLTQLQSSLGTASANAAAERARTAELDEELKRRSMRIEALEARLTHLETTEDEVTSLRISHDDLEQRAARVTAVESEIVELRRSNSDLRVRNEEAEQRALRVVELEAKLRSAEREAEGLRSAASAFEATSKTERADLEQSAARLQALEAEISTTEQSLALATTEHELELEAAHHDLATADARISELQETLDKASAPRPHKAKAKAKALRAELADCAKTNKGLRGDLKAAQRAADHSSAAAEAMRTELASAKRDAKQRATTISALRTDLVKARTAKARHRDKRLASAQAKAADLATQLDGTDDLKLISGIGPKLEKKLNELGITRFSHLAVMKKSDVEALQQQLPQFPGRIKRDHWVKQAERLQRSDKDK